jgi:hypothetical protein
LGTGGCSLAGNLDGRWVPAQAAGALRAAALQRQIRRIQTVFETISG